MTNSAGWATLDVIPSLKGFRADLERQSRGDFERVGRDGGRRLGDAAGREASGRIASSLRATIGGALAGAGVVEMFKATYSAASEAEQSVGGAEAVFGQFADGVISKSHEASTALGLSAHAYLELITVSGAMLKNKGIEDFAAQSERLVQIGADLAATYGGSTTQAVEALNAAMRGESDPIERYGISLNEVAVKAKAGAMGLGDLDGASGELFKTQARLALIMDQSADAQGGFARESGTAANEAQKLSAAWEDVQARVGEKALPALSSMMEMLRDDALPALEGTAEAATTVAGALAALPGPVKAAAGAFLALKAASALGITSAVVSGYGRASAGVEALRRQVAITADAYRNATTVTRQFAGQSVRVSSGVSRMSGAMAAAGASAASMGASMRRGMGGVVGAMGGPWGIAIMGGIALLTTFIGKQKAAAAHVKELAGSLSEQGALTAESSAAITKALMDEGAYENAKRLGISYTVITEAAKGSASAVAEYEAAVAKAAKDTSLISQAGGVRELSAVFADLDDAVMGQKGDVAKAREEWQIYKQVADESAGATESNVAPMKNYVTQLEEAYVALNQLTEAEKGRANDNIGRLQSELDLIEKVQEVRDSLTKGEGLFAGAGIDKATEKGRANLQALLDMANAWTNADDATQNNRGAFKRFRDDFLEAAEAMEVPEGQAKKLAKRLLEVPESAPIEFRSKGFQKRMDEIETLERAIRGLPIAEIDWSPRGMGAPQMYATDRNGRTDQPSTGDGPSERRAPMVHVEKVVAQDYRDMQRQLQRQSQRAAIGGSPW